MRAVTGMVLALALIGCGKGASEDGTGSGLMVNKTAADVKAAKVDAAIQNTVAERGPAAVAPGLPVSKPPRSARDPNTLPPAFQGRWALTPADCDVSRGDAKGLLKITGDTLKFYESTGTITALDKASDYAVTAHIDFEGEGQKWQTRTTLALVTGGTALLRTEQSPTKTYRYERC